MSELTIYRTEWCPFCQRAEALLASKNLNNLQKIDVEVEPGARDAMIERANGRTSVPQIFINGTHVGGCDDLFALEQRGELDPMLAG